jgi:hypothetical protein
MSPTDWAKTYAAMDKRIELKYQQLPKGEQTGKRPPPESVRAKPDDNRNPWDAVEHQAMKILDSIIISDR